MTWEPSKDDVNAIEFRNADILNWPHINFMREVIHIRLGCVYIEFVYVSGLVPRTVKGEVEPPTPCKKALCARLLRCLIMRDAEL